MTPHIGSAGAATREKMVALAIQNAVNVLGGKGA